MGHRGRRRLQEGTETSQLCVYLPAPVHDEIIRRASSLRVTVSQVVRDALNSYLKNRQAQRVEGP